MPLNIVLYQTDIAQNFGTIARTCVTMGARLHVIEPLGFLWDEKKMRRAGMDYLDRVDLVRHKSFDRFMETEKDNMGRLVVSTTKGADHLQNYKPMAADYILFGRESAGVPEEIHNLADERIRIPMVEGERSMNIAVSAGIVMYDAMNKLGILPEAH
jgi:tRNA (cytidine/uridine-2'-O-)-methyltransferase